MLIRVYEPMVTRPCKYCLSLQDDAVFADFDLSKSGCIFLVRISFDGYGCCYPDTKIGITEMSEAESSLFIESVEASNIYRPELSKVLSSYFFKNRESLWKQAFVAHGLI
jgi:hypothetical protein